MGSKHFCRARGAVLLTIKSSPEQNFLSLLFSDLRTSGIQSVWLGSTSAGSGQPWLWVDGSAVGPYKNWYIGEPRSRNKTACSLIYTGSERGLWATTDDCETGKSFICKIAIGKPVIVPTTPAPRYYCAPGWERSGEKCYKVFSQALPWPAARTSCKNLGADLVRISSAEVNLFIFNIAKETVWLGLHRRNKQGKFMWLDDSTEPLWEFWADGEPSNAANKNCALQLRDSGKNGRWAAAECDTNLAYVCDTDAGKEGKTETTTPLPTPSWDPRCGFQWNLDKLSDNCYLFGREYTTWNDARVTCEVHGSHLLSIINPHEQAYITGRLHNSDDINFWIGMNDRGMRGIWAWSDNSPVPYVNWDSGYPKSGDCGAYNVPKTAWQTKVCSNRYGYICKKKALAPTPLTPPLPTTSTTRMPTTTREGTTKGCRKGWLKFDHKCYMFAKDETVSWTEAKTKCRENGGDLVSIAGAVEQGYVEAKVSELYKFPDNHPEDGVWIGLSAIAHPNYYSWSDGMDVTFTSWDVGEPNSEAERGQGCVHLRIKTGRWKVIACSDTGRGYVCKRDMEDIPIPATTPIIEGCPQGTDWEYKSNCYWMNSQISTWSSADKGCKGKGAHLVYILDSLEQSFLASRLSSVYGDWWIGFNNLQSYWGKWSWSSRKTGSYTNWVPEFTGKEREKCAVMKTGERLGLWQPVDCALRKPCICKVPRIVPTTTTTPGPSTVRPFSCPDRWNEKDGYCYQIKKYDSTYNRKTWVDALQHCRSQGADLASIHNSSVASAVGSWIGRHYGSTWIGLHTRSPDKKHKWTDGSGTEFLYWKDGQPDNHNGMEDCVEIDSVYPYKWKHTQCAFKRNWVCKVKKGDSIVTPTKPPSTLKPNLHCGVDEEWYFFNNYCYYVEKSTNQKTWYDARAFCMKNGGDLASIHDLHSHNFLINLLRNRLANREVWIGLNFLDRDQYRWSDGTTSEFLNWDRGQPNDENYGQLCVTMNRPTGFWKDENCGQRNVFVCKKFNGTLTPQTHPVTSPVEGFCPSGFYGLGDKCFKAFSFRANERIDFHSAVSECRSLGASYDLTSITSNQEQKTVNALVSDAADEDVSVGFWIGLNRLNDNKLHWIDNSQLTFTNWGRDQPAYKKQCAQVQVEKKAFGKWQLTSCSNKAGYICGYYKRHGQAITTPPTIPPSKCKPGYFPFKEHCYILLSTAQKWQEAEDQCVQDGGHLASIQDLGENSFASLFLQDVLGPVWLGIMSPKDSGEYAWVDQWPMRYTNWAYGNPADAFSRPCGVMLDSGQWNGTECTWKYPGLCRTTSVLPPTTPPYVPGKCPAEDWGYYHKHCFKAETSTRYDFLKSAHICFQYSSDLASIHSKELNMVIHEALQKSTSRYKYDVWIGLTRPDHEKPWIWLDGSPVEYTNWKTPSEGESKASQNCVYMEFKTGKWRSTYCTYATKGHLCKTEKIPYTRPPGPSTTKPPVPNPSSSTSTPSVSSRPPSTSQLNSVATRLSTILPTITPTERNPKPSVPSGGISTAEAIGISFGVIALILIIMVLVVVFMQRKGRQNNPRQPFAHHSYGSETSFQNVLYSASGETIQPKSSSITFDHTQLVHPNGKKESDS